MSLYSAKITYSDGFVAYLSHMDRTKWNKRTAQKLADDFRKRRCRWRCAMPINKHTLLSILQGALRLIESGEATFMCRAIDAAARHMEHAVHAPCLLYRMEAINLLLPWKPLGVAVDDAWFDIDEEARELRVAILSQVIRDLSLQLKLQEQLAA